MESVDIPSRSSTESASIENNKKYEKTADRELSEMKSRKYKIRAKQINRE